GDPTVTGNGGQSTYGAPFADEIEAILEHNARGILSIANKQPHLYSTYTVFGKVIDG
ncbi:hypothetical protein BC830DRAFT_1054013, partial [Chytriomyces sp. MP71]